MLDFSAQGFDTAFEQLRSKRQSETTKPFLARGNKVKRCSRCQLGHCICSFRTPCAVNFDIVLLMHRNEILKPTNTGRLIADCFPNNTHAFIWARTHVDAQLEELLAAPDRDWALLFPGEKNPTRQSITHDVNKTPKCSKKLTFLIIDGTWKQARKMYSQSHWLHTMPALSLNPINVSEYHLRKAPETFQTSTAEAFVSALKNNGHSTEGQMLNAYFQKFNSHYHASKLNISPDQLALKNSV